MSPTVLGSEAVAVLKPILKHQYHAAFAMLRETIERCPDDLWLSRDPRNAFWQVAYHTVYFTHLYLEPNESAFRPWAGHQRSAQHEDGIGGDADPASPLPLIPEPYTRQDVLTYCSLCDQMVDRSVDDMDLDSPDCGFWWYKVSKLEHQFINLRHIQHHTAQLADRLRAAANIGIRWIGSRPAAP